MDSRKSSRSSCSVRELFELHAIRIFFQKRGPSELRALDRIEAKHRALLATIETDFHQFSELDAEFHREIARAAKNRFIDQFQELISLVFHYHYHWHKADERERNQTPSTNISKSSRRFEVTISRPC